MDLAGKLDEIVRLDLFSNAFKLKRTERLHLDLSFYIHVGTLINENLAIFRRVT